MKKLDLYYIDLKYIRNLSHVDDNVMSISPQRGKQNRPFVGVVVLMNIVLIYSLHYSVFRITQLYTASYCICLLLHSPTFSHTFLISRYSSQGLTLLSIKFYQMLFSILNYSEFMINWASRAPVYTRCIFASRGPVRTPHLLDRPARRETACWGTSPIP